MAKVNRAIKRAGALSASSYKVQSIDRAVQIMRFLAESSYPRNLADVAKACSLHKSSTHRYLVCLLRHGFIARTVRGRYVPRVALPALALAKEPANG
jgi:DNA-binding IclR family transcriptional regulator